MAASRLFGNKIPPACKYCQNAMQVFNQNQVLCCKKGVVKGDYFCKHYFYDPLKRVPNRPLSVPKFSKEDFSL